MIYITNPNLHPHTTAKKGLIKFLYDLVELDSIIYFKQLYLFIFQLFLSVLKRERVKLKSGWDNRH